MKLNQIVCIDALEGLKQLEDNSVTLFCMSPPYANIRASYPGPSAYQFVNWFLPFATEMKRAMTDDGSLIINICDKVENGERIPYVFELVIRLREMGLKYMDCIIWAKKNGVPNAGRRRANYFEYILHLSKTLKPKWNPDSIRTPYPEVSIKRAKSPIKNNVSNRESRNGETTEYKEWKLNPLGSHPKNLIFFPKDSGKNHIASYHIDLPTHFIKAHSDINDLVVDPFAGRGTTLAAARLLNRRFLGFEIKPEHILMAIEGYGLDSSISP